MKMKRSLLMLVLAGGMSSTAMAADNYIGGAFGSTDPDVDGYDSSDTLKIFGGQRFGNIGYEVGYHDFDRFDRSGSPSGEHNTGSALEASVVGYLPLNNKFDLFGKVGMAAWSLDVNDNTGTIFTDDGIDLTYGVGAQFKPMDNLSLRVEYQIMNDVSGADLSSTMLGAAFHF
jgi:OOP family OmpA-OmpF porin